MPPIQIKVSDEKGSSKILSPEDSLKIGEKILTTRIALDAFLQGIPIVANGLTFTIVDN